MTCHWVSIKSYTTADTCGAGTDTPPGEPEYTPVLSEVHDARSLVFCAVFCRSLLFSFFSLSFGHYILSFFDLQLLITLWYLQTFHKNQFLYCGQMFHSVIMLIYILDVHFLCNVAY